MASACSRVNRMPVLDVPAQTRKGRGLDTGLGKDSQSFRVKNSPSRVTESSLHSRLMAVIHSRARS